MKKHESNLVVLSVMLCWASAYVFIKGLPPELSDFGYLALMNGIAALILIVIFAKRFRYLNKSNIKHGVILGLLMMLVLMFEKAGVIVNRMPDMSFVDTIDTGDIPILTCIPDDKLMSLSDMKGDSVLELSSDSSIYKGAKEALQKLNII